MFNFFKTTNRHSLEKPKNQTSEILFELINNKNASRSELTEMTGFLNVTAIILKISLTHEINIKCDLKEIKNKHGRNVRFGIYSLTDASRMAALRKYNQINK
jgi:hypothetical protein